MPAKIKKRLLKKIKNSRGETITETIVALLIVVLAMTMLAGSIVSAAKVNKKVEDASIAFTTVKEDGTTTNISAPSSGTVTIGHSTGVTTTPVSVNIYTTDDDNEYVYYEK